MAGLIAEDIDEHVPDPLALFLRIADPLKRRQKSIGRVHNVQIRLEVIAECAADTLGLSRAKQSVIDEDAGDARTDCPDQERCGHG